MSDGNRHPAPLVERRRRALRDRVVVLRGELDEQLRAAAEILVRQHHQTAALGFRNEQVPGPKSYTQVCAGDAPRRTCRIDRVTASGCR